MTQLTNVISNVTNQSSATTGGAYANYGTLTVESGVTFAENKVTSAAATGGAIYNDGQPNNDGILNIGDNVTFNKNTSARYAGAIYNVVGSVTIGNKAVFSENIALIGGALVNGGNGSMTIGDDARFIKNEVSGAVTPVGTGGAISNNDSTLEIGHNALFQENKATHSGAAISQQTTSSSTTSAKLTIKSGAQFIGNTASRAAAIYNYNSLATTTSSIEIGDNVLFKDNYADASLYGTGRGSGGAIGNYDGAMEIGENAVFEGNKADKDGGAIDNADFNNSGTDPVITFKNSTQFINNTAVGDGGAIFNSGEATFNGDVTFKGNLAAYNAITNTGTLNDIYMGNATSIVSFNGGIVTLDGGISGSTGTVNFEGGTTLNVGLSEGATPIINVGTIATTGSGKVFLTIKNGVTNGNLIFAASADMTSFLDNLDISNTLFNISGTNGTFTVGKKSNEQIAAATGASSNAANAISGIISGTAPQSNTAFNTLADKILGLLQSQDFADVAQGVKAAETMAPTAAPVVQAITTQNNSMVYGAIGNRLSGGASSGMSSGDVAFNDAAIWIQGLYNGAKLNGKNGFNSNSAGVAFGIDADLNDVFKLGVGYAYTYSSIRPTGVRTEVDSHTPFIYGEFKPNQWYVNAILSYTMGKYDESKRVLNTKVKGKYDVDALGLQVMAGYQVPLNNITVTPEAGIRYMNVRQDSYTDSIGNTTKSKSTDTFTGVAGVKFSKNITAGAYDYITPEFKLALTYDLARPSNSYSMKMANNTIVNTKADRMERFGIETALGATANINDKVEIYVGYEGAFRKDYQNHTGIINAKYHF